MKKIYALVLLTLAGCSDPGNFSNFDGAELLADVVGYIDSDNPGRGLADYPSDNNEDVPKSYAMILLGAVDEARLNGLSKINALGAKAGEWLLENSDANKDGVIGWGVPVAWDAYGDGTINPKNTEYSISTAIVVDALLGWHEFVGVQDKEKIIKLVEEALKPYLDSRVRTPSGMLPYSLMQHDWKYDTFNSAIYLAGQMQRFSKYVNDEVLKESLQEAADATVKSLIKNKLLSKKGSWYWYYSIQEEIPNDLPHAGYIVEGLLIYIENEGRFANQIEKDKVFSHLYDFVDGKGAVRGWPVFASSIKTPPRLYDLSIAAQLGCRFSRLEDGEIFLAPVMAYKSLSGGYTKYPSDTSGNKRVAEYESYLYRALKACGY